MDRQSRHYTNMANCMRNGRMHLKFFERNYWNLTTKVEFHFTIQFNNAFDVINFKLLNPFSSNDFDLPTHRAVESQQKHTLRIPRCMSYLWFSGLTPSPENSKNLFLHPIPEGGLSPGINSRYCALYIRGRNQKNLAVNLAMSWNHRRFMILQHDNTIFIKSTISACTYCEFWIFQLEENCPLYLLFLSPSSSGIPVCNDALSL